MPKRILVLALGASLFCVPLHANTLEDIAVQCEVSGIAETFIDTFAPKRVNSVTTAEGAASLAKQFEQLTLGSNNLVDLFSFYLSKPLYKDIRTRLLSCQIRLADEISAIIASESFNALAERLETYGQGDIRALGKRMRLLRQEQLSDTEKAQLYTATAKLISMKNDSDFSLLTVDRCSLPVDLTKAEQLEPPGIERQIASYLTAQPNSSCRELAWKAYQTRDDNSAQALAIIHNIRQQQATRSGYVDYATMMANDSFLGTTEAVERFLTVTRPPRALAPWDLGRALKASATQIPMLDSQWLLSQVLTASLQFGIHADWLQDTHLRLWFRGRMLGELAIGDGPKPAFQLGRRGIFTKQFAQGLLTIPDTLSGRRQVRLFLDAFAQAIAALLSTERYYLLASADQTLQTLGATWFAAKLDTLLDAKLPPLTAREALIDKHRQSQNYYRAALALDFYRSTPANNDRFAEYFLGQWPSPSSQYYSNVSLLQEGPAQFRTLWQQWLAAYLLKLPMDDDALFDRLMTTSPESQAELLEDILGQKYSLSSLIGRVADARH